LARGEEKTEERKADRTSEPGEKKLTEEGENYAKPAKKTKSPPGE